MAVRKEILSPVEVDFSIVKVIDNINRHNNIYSEISDILSDFKNDNNVQQTIQQTSESSSVRKTTAGQPDWQQWEHKGSGRVSEKTSFLSR